MMEVYQDPIAEPVSGQSSRDLSENIVIFPFPDLLRETHLAEMAIKP